MEEVDNYIPELVAAVETAMCHSTLPELRMKAYQVCEIFKEKSPDLVSKCGIKLTMETSNSSIVRHFGLKLIEHCIKFRWYELGIEDKVCIKENTIKFITQGIKVDLAETTPIKDAVTRVVVEMVKREWPQHWPTFFSEMNSISAVGASQTEIVLRILLRIAEDVVTFKSLPQQRSSDITSALNTNMADIMAYLLNLVVQHTNSYQNSMGVNDHMRILHQKMLLTVLETLSGYVEWVATQHILLNNGQLLQLLCFLLKDESLQSAAADCLLLITGRKGKPSDRKPLLDLFCDDTMKIMIEAATVSSQLPLTEHRFYFLKRLVQVLTSLGAQLSHLWVSENDQPPPNFNDYLLLMVAFSDHPSRVLGSSTYVLFASFMKHAFISKNAIFLSFLPAILQKTQSTLSKVGFPSQSNSKSCEYSRFDFDSDQEFSQFFAKFRCEVSLVVRQTTTLMPSMTFNFTAEWLTDRLQRPSTPDDGEYCNLSSATFLEWDALAFFLENVMAHFQNVPSEESNTSKGIKLLKDVLCYDTKDPLILSSILSCISALFHYITACPDQLTLVLHKIFSAAQFTMVGQTKATRSKAVQNVRRHACSCLVKICKTHPDLLLPGFSQLYDHIKHLSSDPAQLSQLEKCTLMEALILISNRFCDFQKQTEFIAEILHPVKELWLCPPLLESLWNVEKIMSFIGVNQAPVEPSDADTCGINRSNIVFCLNTIQAVIKRCQWPQDAEAATKGGFMSADRLYLRNPALPHIGILFDNVLALVRTLNSMWQPENMAKRHPDFVKAYELIDNEKLAILGITPQCVDNTDTSVSKNPIDRMQNFFTNSYEGCCHILGDIGASFGQEFYQVPNLATSLVNSAWCSVEHLPYYRLRPLIRVFVKPYIQKCPVALYRTAVLPLLQVLCPHMLEKLSSSWEKHNAQAIIEIEEDNPEAQEVLDDQLLRVVTRDYIDLLCNACVRDQHSQSATPAVDVENDEMEVRAQPDKLGPKEVMLTELGKLMLSCENLLPCIMRTVLSGLSWDDTGCSLKSARLTIPVLREVMDRGLMSGEDACHLLTQILFGLQKHGHHDSQQSVLIGVAAAAYSLLRPIYPDLKTVMLSIPSCKENQLEKYDKELLENSTAKPMAEKKIKSGFKALVSDVIGKDLGQQFSRSAEIHNLPPLLRKKPKKKNVLDETQNLDICVLFCNDGTQ